MSDEGFHGGDLFTIAANGNDVRNRTRNRKSSVSSLFWLTPDRILFTEIVGGGGAISELTLANNSVRTIWKGAEALHAFGNFPDFAISRDGKLAAAERSSFETPPEVWAGPVAIPLKLPRGAKPRILSGLTMASTFRAGFFHRGKWSPTRNIPWSSSSMADLPAPRRRTGPLRLECREPSSPLSRLEVTTF